MARLCRRRAHKTFQQGAGVYYYSSARSAALVQGARPTPYWPCEGRAHGQFSGAMEETEKGQKVSTYKSSDVFVHLATIKIGRAASVDEEPTTTIPISIALQKAST